MLPQLLADFILQAKLPINKVSASFYLNSFRTIMNVMQHINHLEEVPVTIQVCSNLRAILNKIDFLDRSSGIGYNIARYQAYHCKLYDLNAWCNSNKQEILSFIEKIYPEADDKEMEKAAKRLRTQFR